LRGQAVPEHVPDLIYPPIARAAHVVGDVAVTFRVRATGETADVQAVSGPPMLRSVAVENIKAWRFRNNLPVSTAISKAMFHFRLEEPGGGYDDNDAPGTRVEVSAGNQVSVISIGTIGLNRSSCPNIGDRLPPPALIGGDFVELHRWNEEVRVALDGAVTWREKDQDQPKDGEIAESQARELLAKFQTATMWQLCGDYAQSGLMDGGYSWVLLHLGGREKRVSEYGQSAPPLFGELEDAIDSAADTHQWRHGDPKTENIVEVGYESLPKPGKTKLMAAAHKGSRERAIEALAAGDKVTDTDPSGWTSLMYAAGSYQTGEVEKLLLAKGANVNARSLAGDTALMAAAASGSADEDLLDAGADVNAKNADGVTALMLLAQHGDSEEIGTMLKRGADATARDAKGRTAMDYLEAANCGRPIVEQKDPATMRIGHIVCNAFGDEFELTKNVLLVAGAKATRAWIPTE
jgi:hypothetical protein